MALISQQELGHVQCWTSTDVGGIFNPTGTIPGYLLRQINIVVQYYILSQTIIVKQNALILEKRKDTFGPKSNINSCQHMTTPLNWIALK